MPSFVTDLDVVDQSTVERTGPAYPVAQWINGDPKLASVGGVMHTGGIVLPTKYADESVAPPPGWPRTTIAFSSGKSEDVLAAQKPRLAVIRTRFRWFIVFNGVATYYPRSAYVADSGMRGHLQAVCGLYGFDFPVVVTFKGKASQEFERLSREFTTKTQDAARKVSADRKASFPRFAFYMKLAAGPHVKVGQKGQESIITPPVLELPTALSEEYLSKIYVGRDNLLAYQDWFHEAEEWASLWNKPGAEEAQPAEDTGEAENGNGNWPPSDAEFAKPGIPVTVPVVDVLTDAEALNALKLHGIDRDTFKQALIEDHGRASYSPERDTALVRRLIAQNQPGETEIA